MPKDQFQSAQEQEIRRWIQKHQEEMICCPNQPGLLVISKQSCLKRYRAALGRVFENVSREDPFHFALKKGLGLCEGCPIGKRLDAEEQKGRSKRPSKRSSTDH
jgi:hypothetical protein